MGSDRVLRKNAFEAYYNRLGAFKNTVAAALDGQFRSLKFFSDARHYPSTRAAALDAKAHALVDKYARQAEKIYNDVYGRLAR